MSESIQATPIRIPPELAAVVDIRSREAYVRVFGDLEYWTPFARHVCQTLGLSHDDIAGGVVGTYPTCLVDRAHVVKICGPWYNGVANAAAEVAAMRAVSGLDGSRAPRLIAYGPLVGSGGGDWSYLVSAFCRGEPLADVGGGLGDERLGHIGRELGAYVRRVHETAVSAKDLGGERADWAGWISGQREGLAGRLRARDSVPERWVDQAEAYVPPAGQLVDTAGQLRLLHADITADHVLVDDDSGGALNWSLIDWGDARLGDPFYELPALFLDAMEGRRTALASFLDGYGWVWGVDAQRRAMSMTLLHEFDVLGPFVAQRRELLDISDLDDLAEAIWAL